MDEKFHLSSELEKKRYELHNYDIHDAGYRNFTAPLINAVLKNFNNQHSGLDYGCGRVPVISEILKENGYLIKIYDPFFHPDTKPLEDKYDYIICCEVFEHFRHPDKEMIKLKNLLKPNGKLYIMTHIYAEPTNFSKWYYRNDPTHIFIAQPETFKYIEKEFCMKIVSMNDRLVIFEI
ncbi:MAG TPA: methyltransferase domain-containing protein [bacterium]|nr:methyltransferase domain-containing protein [bacterium]HOB71458.1 methyltransferase domain-containing protein [bacterium]HPG35825.1 methyltransferase domain-containing protein [bacterium]HPM47882.1 methyltransferase domain-containing protein [bacterium]HPV21763.1 methyltransferase domain-containing protein [bacterium]